MDLAGSMNIVFHADLSKLVEHRPSVLYWVLQPGSDVGGIGMGLVRMVRPWDEWLIVWGYDAADGPPSLSDAYTRSVVRANRSIGDTARIFDALGVSGTGDPERMRENMAARRGGGPDAEKQRRAL